MPELCRTSTDRGQLVAGVAVGLIDLIGCNSISASASRISQTYSVCRSPPGSSGATSPAGGHYRNCSGSILHSPLQSYWYSYYSRLSLPRRADGWKRRFSVEHIGLIVEQLKAKSLSGTLGAEERDEFISLFCGFFH